MTSEAAETHFIAKPGRKLPKGELWLGTELLACAGFADSAENHLRLADQLAHDVVCFPVAWETHHKPALGYRFFSYAELRSAIRTGDQAVAAVVDGPFQELVNRVGLMRVATDWFQHPDELADAYALEQSHALETIQKCLEQGVRLVVIADDLASQNGPLFKPADLQSLCGAFYTRAVEGIHAAGIPVFWHCCGSILPLIPLIGDWRFDGLAAVQHNTNDLIALSGALDHRLSIMGGIENELLDADTPAPNAIDAFNRIVSTLSPTGRLILGSSCGLYRGAYLPRIKKIYAMAARLTAGG